MDIDAIAQPALEKIEQLQGVDLLVGLLGGAGHTAQAAALVRDGVQKLPHPANAVLLVDGGESESSAAGNLPVPVVAVRLPGPPSRDYFARITLGAYQAIFGVAAKIGARACSVIASELETVTPEGIDSLVRPALELEFDLVMPRYARNKWEGLLNRSVISPLSRALYGKRIQNPMGPDFAFSSRLIRALLNDQALAHRADPGHPLASAVSAAVRENLRICEAQLGPHHPPPADPNALSSLVAGVLGPLFLDMEWNAPLWQRVRGSQLVPSSGDPLPAAAETAGIDAQRLLDSFQLGVKSLLDVWGLVLSPTNLLEIRKLAHVPAEMFRLPDDLWVAVVYDFALAHRVRSINRDHLLRSFTPLYLGWIASYANEMEIAGAAAVEARIERLARAFEAGKTYLMSRWRWPDRFNP